MRLSAELFEQITEMLKSDIKPDRDKRLEPRVGMAGEATLLSVRDGRRVAAQVRIRDISRGGLGIYYNRKISGNQRFIIQLQSVRGQHIWLVCVAAYCRRAESDRFIIGGRIKNVMDSMQVQKLQARLGESAPDSFLDPMQKYTAERISRAILR